MTVQAQRSASDSVPASSLTLTKTGLRLLDAQGQSLDELKLRAKRWDQRRFADGRTVALLLDADSGALRLIEGRDGRLRERARWPGPAMNVESLCLFLEPDQQLLQAFVLGDDGIGEQWLLAEASASTSASTTATGRAAQSKAAPASPVMRRFATAPDAKACLVRDDEARLYVAEDGVGLWSQAADAERHDRRLVAPGLAPSEMGRWLEAHPAATPTRIAVAVPTAQTEPVRGSGDAADDPAIWVHPTHPARSRILGTDKKLGLAVYDLQGRETQFLPVGRVNNVDLRQGLTYGDRASAARGSRGASTTWDLAVATQRDRRSVLVFAIDPQGRAATVAELPTGLEEVYGICSARNPAGGLDIFVNDKDGRLLQMRLRREGKSWHADTVAQFKLDSQPEGCVADEAGHQLFVGEEKRGIWRLALAADGLLGEARMILAVGDTLHADVEGMAVHRSARGARLVVSSQGSDSYVVLDAESPYAVKGSFRIGINAAVGIDAASETDGLDVTSAPLGGPYGEGLLVVQDGHKRWPQGRQNFKLVPWSAVVRIESAR
ncbi:phytase [Roseateles amylovorans]|uniref:Phytase n=1 Tax=Roseateles amylovorans TaxID=2978473 RepID=A0ABY6B1L8_9BURK|nr:phytase [Roseateles amylovorans]UXH78735.1 phytase [Roseateles amylovorans]